jgi:hypothetical protein
MVVGLSGIGHWLSGIGHWLLAIGYRLSAIGYRLSAIGYNRLSVISYQSGPESRTIALTIGYRA